MSLGRFPSERPLAVTAPARPRGWEGGELQAVPGSVRAGTGRAEGRARRRERRARFEEGAGGGAG